jgi:chromosome segregation ATPase
VIDYPSVPLSQSSARLGDHKRSLHRHAATRRGKKERETHAPKPEKKDKLEVERAQTDVVHSQNTHRQQPKVSRTREKKLHADLISAEDERERLKPLISTLQASDSKPPHEDTVPDAKTRCAEVEAAEATVSKLRADLNAAMDRVRVVEEQLNDHLKLASSKDHTISSITEESQVAQTKLKEAEATTLKLREDLKAAMSRVRHLEEQLYNQTRRVSSKDRVIQSITEGSQAARMKLKGAEDEVARLDAELRHERDRWLCERKELLDERSRIRDCHEAEICRVTQGAQDAREKLLALREAQSLILARRQPSLDPVHSPRSPLLTNEPVDTGQSPLPPERVLDTHTPSICPAIDPDPTLCPTKSSLDPSTHDWGGGSTQRAHYLLQISACFDQVSDVAEAQRTALEDLVDRICELESERAQVVKPPDPDDRRLEEEERAATMERLRLVEQEVLTLRRSLCQSRKTTWEVENHAQDLKHELDKCQADLREASERAQVVKPPEPDDRRLEEEERAATMERLRLVEQEVLTLRRSLCQSRKTTWEVESHAQHLKRELDKYQADLREAESKLQDMKDERRSGEIKFVQVVERLRLRSSELELSRAETEESRFKCSQATVLSATLQERINELETEVTTLKSTQNHSTTSTALVVPTSLASFCPMDIGMRPPAIIYVISYAHTFENYQIFQQFHTVTIYSYSSR